MNTLFSNGWSIHLWIHYSIVDRVLKFMSRLFRYGYIIQIYEYTIKKWINCSMYGYTHDSIIYRVFIQTDEYSIQLWIEYSYVSIHYSIMDRLFKFMDKLLNCGYGCQIFGYTIQS